MGNEASDNSVRSTRDALLYFRTKDEINDNDKNKFESNILEHIFYV